MQGITSIALLFLYILVVTGAIMCIFSLHKQNKRIKYQTTRILVNNFVNKKQIKINPEDLDEMIYIIGGKR